ncbi:HesA/MoeB/ThiF family protein [Candidatus Woesearchaeota archaeon]|nr:HesA/MoeB/ThiF family protein [Candidatus Woesearchaeota archaeon]
MDDFQQADQGRYSRQEILSIVGREGQEKIRRASMVIVGIGALGSSTAELLTRAGIGKIILIDRDIIELSNLQRQNIFAEKDVGRSKAAVAAEKLKEINSKIEIIPKAVDLNTKNIDTLLEADLVLDCTDNLQTRFLINYYCKKNNKRWIYAAAIRTEGYVMAIFPNGPCLRCFLTAPPPETCTTAGVLNTIITSISAQQVTLALKIITQRAETVRENELIHLNIWENTIKKIRIPKKKNCIACTQGEELSQHENKIKSMLFCSTGRYQINGKVKDFIEIEQRWQKVGKVFRDNETLSFQNILLFKDGRALIKAQSEAEASTIYDKWVGN